MSIRILHQYELLHSLDHILYILFTLSYLLSPSHILTFILRLLSQLQFANPRQIHPKRSLRFFIALWFGLHCVNIGIHAVEGSQGTKGNDWSGKGVTLDFIGQMNTPSTFHLVLLDFLIAFLQFILIIVAFAQLSSTNPLSSPDDQSISTINARRSAALLGETEEFEEEEFVEERSKFKPNEDSLMKPVIDIRFRAVWVELIHPDRFEEESMV